MHSVTQEQWREWLSHPVTEAVKEAIRSRVADAIEQVIDSPANERDFDQFVKGMIRGLKEALDVQPEVIIQEVRDDSEV